MDAGWEAREPRVTSVYRPPIAIGTPPVYTQACMHAPPSRTHAPPSRTHLSITMLSYPLTSTGRTVRIASRSAARRSSGSAPGANSSGQRMAAASKAEAVICGEACMCDHIYCGS